MCMHGVQKIVSNMFLDDRNEKQRKKVFQTFTFVDDLHVLGDLIVE